MISTAYKFIFIHVPKTGGSTIQSTLLPFSDDRKKVSARGDPKHIFEIRGDVTPRKHATLSDYAVALGQSLDDYKIIVCARDPLERALSLYFSPSRLLRLGESGDTFSMPDFLRLVAGMRSFVSFLTVGGGPITPDFVIRFDSLENDFKHVSRSLGLPVSELEVLNVSGDVKGFRDALRKDPAVIAAAQKSFAEDYAYLAYLTGNA